MAECRRNAWSELQDIKKAFEGKSLDTVTTRYFTWRKKWYEKMKVYDSEFARKETGKMIEKVK